MLSEAALHERIYERSAGLASAFPRVGLGPGDDCAVVYGASPAREGLLVTVDQLVEGRHFTPETSVELIARKAIARSISDIAAMAGTPAWALAAAVLPRGYAHAPELFDACHRWGTHFGAPLVGGDIAVSPPGTPLILSITVAGDPAPSRGPVTRSGAKPGDDVYVTGKIGGSLASGRHLTFEPRVAEGRFLAGSVLSDLHAMIDVSDGLGRDAARISAASKVRIELDARLIPLHVERAEPVRDVLAACADGEDYELLFTAAPGVMHRILPPRALASMTRIGRVTEGQGCVLIGAGPAAIDLTDVGWDHRG